MLDADGQPVLRSDPLRLAHWWELASRIGSRPAVEADRMAHDVYDVAEAFRALRKRCEQEWAALNAQLME